MMTEKIKILLLKKGLSTVDLAAKLKAEGKPEGVTPQNLYKKYKKDNFSIKELQEIAEALDVKFEAYFVTKDGERI